MIHALTVDVEDWYHPLLLRRGASRISLIEEPTRLLLDLLRGEGIRATFFVVGEVASRLPGLVARMAMDGHEIGCHGHAHVPLKELSRERFEEDLSLAEAAIEAACGVRPALFRAASFGLSPATAWVAQVLARRGYRVDSSLLPSPFGLAGWARGRRYPHELAPGLWEIPASTSPRARLPYGGSVYLRVWPRRCVQAWVEANAREGLPSMFYVHPWEFLASLPPTPKARWGRWVSVWGQRRFLDAFDWIVRTFPLGPLGEAFAPWISRYEP